MSYDIFDKARALLNGEVLDDQPEGHAAVEAQAAAQAAMAQQRGRVMAADGEDDVRVGRRQKANLLTWQAQAAMPSFPGQP